MTEALGVAALMAATLTTGLTAGLLYAFSVAVMPGLRQSEDRTFVQAMRRINVAILNGWFALVFAGAPVLIAVAAGLHLAGAGGHDALPWIVAAFLLYGVALAITGVVNVPLNNRIDAAGEPADPAELAAVRRGFEARWVRWNTIRTVPCVAAFGCLAWALTL